jgi:hypothetical protein
VDHSTTPTRPATKKPAHRGIGGGVRREASIEGVRFRCRLQAAHRLYSPLTHRNLWHAGQRLKRAFRFRKFFGYFLPKKVTTRTNSALCLRHGVGRDAPGLPCVSGRESRTTPVAPDSRPAFFLSTKLHEGHEENALACEQNTSPSFFFHQDTAEPCPYTSFVGPCLQHVLSACGVETPR